MIKHSFFSPIERNKKKKNQKHAMIPYFTGGLNSVIQPLKIAIAECPKNKSRIFKFARCGSHDYMWILVPHV